MVGEECPGGNAVFQTTFVPGPNSTGKSGFPSAIPEEFGPRNWLQSAAETDIKARTLRMNPTRAIPRSVTWLGLGTGPRVSCILHKGDSSEIRWAYSCTHCRRQFRRSSLEPKRPRIGTPWHQTVRKARRSRRSPEPVGDHLGTRQQALGHRTNGQANHARPPRHRRTQRRHHDQ